jgi:dolichol kinase
MILERRIRKVGFARREDVADTVSEAFRMRTIDIDNPVATRAWPVAPESSLLEDSSGEQPAESGTHPLLRRVSLRELRRRAWHMLPGLLPFVLWGFPHADPLSPTLRLIIVGICVGLAAIIYIQYHEIARQPDEERVRSSCVLGYAGSIVAAVLLFPSAAEIAFAVLAILAFGDGMATLFGKLLRSRSLPWNRDKTWSGFVAFILFALPTAALIYWGESHNPEAAEPGVSLGTAFLCVSFAVVASAIVESVRSRLNDNVRVGIVSLACMAAAHSVFVGW